ncbi:MAG: alpha/beta fold hydrolase, partial [Actinomycetota bacterium]|nr:alpha/beta fold hydrolase [Actinomycetota bacterium]
MMLQDVALAPDGSSAVYSRRTIENGAYRRRLWRVGLEGGRAEPLTSGPGSDKGARYSPDGSSLLFLSDRSGSVQPWILPLAGGEARQAANLKGDVQSAEWAPDGKRIALIAPSGVNRFVTGKTDDPTARRITDLTWRLDGTGVRDQFNSAWVARPSDGKPRRITAPTFEVTGVFWAPDAKRVGVLADPSDGAALMECPKAFTTGRGGGELELIAQLQGSVLGAAWSPGGSLAIVGVDEKDTPEWANPYLFLAEDGMPRRLGAELDLPVANTTYGDLVDPDSWGSFCWTGDGQLTALVSLRGCCLPYRFSLDGGVEPLLESDDVVCSAMAAGEEHVVVVATIGGRAGEVYSVEDGSLRPLSDNGSRWIERWRRDPERHQVNNPEGIAIDTFFVPARGRRSNRPLVVQIHGGPHASHGPTPWLEMMALADAGIHVLYGNPRGSMGYGTEFARSLHGGWGDPDSADILAMVDWAVGEGLTKPGEIGVLGLSYGGYMVNWLLGHFPGRFAAGVSENPVTDMVGE